MIYTNLSEIGFELGDLESHALPLQVLMVKPDHYQVEYVINPHMEGNVGSVDASLAGRQWTALQTAYANLGLEVIAIPGEPGFPDMVFCANQALPGLDGKRARKAILSRMASTERVGEVEVIGGRLAKLGYDPVELRETGRFEGCGDAIWHHDVRLLWCGHGFRSDPEALKEACAMLDVTGILLELGDDTLYHLDTCLSVLNRTTALWVPSAFTSESAAMVEHVIPTLIEVPRDEATSLLACNAHCPDGRHVLIQPGCDVTNRRLKDAGFEIVEIDTSEFLKSGGSVFCMKQMVW